MMIRTALLSALFAVAVASALSPAQAQYYGTVYQAQPLYPYVVQQQPYPQAAQPYPYAVQPQPYPLRARRVRGRADPALVEELRRRGAKRPTISKTVVVREKPVVIEHRRVVDDPPIVIQRHRTVDVPAEPAPRRARTAAAKNNQAGRVIHAEAEVTILGPDRMSIRLFRKRGTDANAKVD